MELPIPDGSRLFGSDWGRAAVLSAWSVFLVQRPPFLACLGMSWHFSGERSKRRQATTRSPALWPACDCLRSQVTARFVTRHSLACGALRGSGLKALDHPQWSDLAIARTTPALVALFSIVTLLTHHGLNAQHMPVRTTAWYTSKALPIFSDTLAWVRHQLWLCGHSCTSPPGPDSINFNQLARHLTDFEFCKALNDPPNM